MSLNTCLIGPCETRSNSLLQLNYAIEQCTFRWVGPKDKIYRWSKVKRTCLRPLRSAAIPPAAESLPLSEERSRERGSGDAWIATDPRAAVERETRAYRPDDHDSDGHDDVDDDDVSDDDVDDDSDDDNDDSDDDESELDAVRPKASTWAIGSNPAEKNGTVRQDGVPTPSSSSSIGAPNRSSGTASTSTTVSEILTQSRRGRELGGEGFWDGISAEQAEQLTAITQSQRRAAQSEQAARRLSQWDMHLDSGRVKKVKPVRAEIEEGAENKFQVLQDRKLAGGRDQGAAAKGMHRNEKKFKGKNRQSNSQV